MLGMARCIAARQLSNIVDQVNSAELPQAWRHATSSQGEKNRSLLKWIIKDNIKRYGQVAGATKRGKTQCRHRFRGQRVVLLLQLRCCFLAAGEPKPSSRMKASSLLNS